MWYALITGKVFDMNNVSAYVFASADESAFVSEHPAWLLPLCGRPMLRWVLDSLPSGCRPTVFCSETHAEYLPEDVTPFPVAEGTGFAAALALALETDDGAGPVLALSAYMPLLKEKTVQSLIAKANADNVPAMTVPDEDVGAFGAAYCFAPGFDFSVLERCNTLTDCFAAGKGAAQLTTDGVESIEISDRCILYEAEFLMRCFINASHMKHGVTLKNPQNTYIDADVSIGSDSVIWPGAMLLGNTHIGKRTVIFGGRLTDTTVGDDCVLQDVVGNRASVGDRVTIGPYVNLRPDTLIANGCKIGDFVEVKNSLIGEGTKLPHLSYIGDADVGERVNVGCGCVFVNYDGYYKHRTTVGNDVFLGCQTNLVAPVSVGDGAYTAAGTTVTANVPDGALAIARSKQENKPGWVEKYRAFKTAQKDS